MNNKTFNIYCDESTHLEHDGQPYMIYGYVSIAYNQMKLAKSQINQIKKSYQYDKELKWTNISEKTYPLYKEIVDYFFMTDLNFRAIVVDKSQIDNNRQDYTFNDFYFRMYFQLLHHKIDMENVYNVYFDIKDTCSQKKLDELKEILKWNATIRNFQFIRSHESCFLQLADVLMGAVNCYMPLNQLKKYPELLEILHLSSLERNISLRKIFNRDIENNPDFSFRQKRIYPIKSEGQVDMDREFTHLTYEEIIEKDENGRKYPKRIFDKDRSMRLHWILYHIEERLSDKIEIFSVEERDTQKRKDAIKTYIYDKDEKYIIVLQPQRSGTSYYLLSAYYLNRDYGVKEIKKKLKKKLSTIY